MDISLVESFSLDHTQVQAPFVRLAGRYRGPKGDVISKFDLRFVQPNQGAIPTGAMHTLEHLLAISFREEMEGVIDVSPMGCRTGFYFLVFGEVDSHAVLDAFKNVLEKVIAAKETPAATAVQCGNFQDHSLSGAIEYARKALDGLHVHE